MKIQHMETGLFRLCAERIATDIAFQKQAKHQNFKNVDHELFTEYRRWQLKQTVLYAYENSRFYRRLYDEHGVSPDDIQCFADIQKLPFTTPQDVANGGYDFLCISQAQVVKPVTFFSSGTTGLRKRIFFSARDVGRILAFFAVGMNTVTASNGVCQIIMPNSIGRGIGALLSQGLGTMQMQAYATDMLDSSEQQIAYTNERHPNVWFGDTGTIYRITKEMQGKVDFRSLGVEILFLTIGNVSDTLAKNLKEIWGCRVVTHYGLTEMGWGLAVDCAQGTGYHYNELDVLAEVVDPDTGSLLPDGVPGELVYTSLDREAMPLIRYRSRDMASLTSTPCPCGHGMDTMGHIIKRIGGNLNLMTQAGTELYPALFEDALFTFSQVVDYQIYWYEERNTLLFRVEVLDQEPRLSTDIEAKLRRLDAVQSGGVGIKVELLASGTLKEFCYEKKRIKRQQLEVDV